MLPPPHQLITDDIIPQYSQPAKEEQAPVSCSLRTSYLPSTRPAPPGVLTSTLSSPPVSFQSMPHRTTFLLPRESDSSTPTSTLGRRRLPGRLFPPPAAEPENPGARAHTFSRFPNLPSRTRTGRLRWSLAETEGAKHPYRRVRDPQPRGSPRSPCPGSRGHSNSPTTRTYHL